MSTVMGIDSSAPTSPISQTQKNIMNTSHVVSDSARPVSVGSRTLSARTVEHDPSEDDEGRCGRPRLGEGQDMVGGMRAASSTPISA